MEGRMADRLERLTMLHDAALDGDVSSLHNLLGMDPRILGRCIIEKSGRFPQSPLHVAAKLGHVQFVMDILKREPGLAEELDQTQRFSPLHVAGANGHLEIVKALIAVNPDMCFARSQEGLNPLHVAAKRGHVRVLNELMQAEPLAVKDLTNRRETVLHLCVKHRQVEALEQLMIALDDVGLLNCKDPAGNTILHLAVSTRQIKMITIILEDKKMDKNAINSNGSTALDICKKLKKDPSRKEIRRSLEDKKVLRASNALRRQDNMGTYSENRRNTLMLVASLIATMAIQIATNPPGGVWQDDEHCPKGKDKCAGTAVMATRDKAIYPILQLSNMLALGSSLGVILLLISGFQYKRHFMRVLMIAMWIAVSATAFTSWLAVSFVSKLNLDDDDSFGAWWLVALLYWVGLMLLLLLAHFIKFIMKLIKSLLRCIRGIIKFCSTTPSSRHSNGV